MRALCYMPLSLIHCVHNLNHMEQWLKWFIIAQLQFKRTKQEAEKEQYLGIWIASGDS